MNKRPLFTISIFFIIGILAGKYFQKDINLIQVFCVFLFFLTATIVSANCRGGLNLPYSLQKIKLKIAHVFLFLAIISLGFLLHLNSSIFPQDHISNFLGKDKLKAEVIGVVKGPAEARGVYYGKVRARYVFELEELQVSGRKSQVLGLAMVRINTENDYRYGDKLLIKGTIVRPGMHNDFSRLRSKNISVRAESRTNFDYRAYLENQNIFAIISAPEKDVMLLARNYKVNPVLRYAYFFREKIKNQFLAKMPLETGAFMRAILLGDRSELPASLNESFRNSGTMHILAISGLNVALIAAAFLYLFRLLRIKRKISYLITMALLVFVMLLTGSSASVVRATIMCIVFMTGMMLGRQVDGYNSLGAAGFFILILNPKDIFNIGFQLSFIAVLSMIYLTPKLMMPVKKDINHYVRKYLLEPFAVSVSATAATFPFILYYFRMGTPIAIVSNIFIVPLMFALMVGGMCFIAFSWAPFLGSFLADFNNMLANIIFFLADFFAKIKFGHFSL